MKIKLFESFKNDERKAWRLTDEMKSKIDSEIRNVLIELVDNGFEIEIDYFAKKISGDNSILVSVHKINNNERFNTDEVKDNLEVLLAYMDENYGVKEHNYDVEVIGAWPNNRAVSEEYPDNLEVIEIDVDITI
jgi:predicted site-specific integrase-resolvase